jgi:hypothetical protein
MKPLPTLLCCALLCATATAAAIPAHAQAPAAATAAASPADSARALGAAKSVLRSYVRRAAERRSQELRPEVVQRLDDYARVIPGDDWLIGHRVGLRIKQGWHTAAVAAAIRCEGTRWWCEALAGFALHVEGSYGDADEAFDRALAAMPETVRCAWGAELAHILDGALRAQYEAADCAERTLLERRIWWLADPLHLLPGNDRRTEHYSRLVGMQLHHETLVFGSSSRCADEHHVAVIRGGWPEWWWNESGPLEPGGPGFAFLPAAALAGRPLDSTAADWDAPLVLRLGERYTPQYGQVRRQDQQTAFFGRGDSILVVGAAAVGRVRGGGMVLTRGEAGERFILPGPDAGWYLLSGMVPRDRYLASLEALRHESGAVRARFGHRLPEPSPSGLALSDLLLFNWADDLDETILAVGPRALGTTTLARNRVIGLFWEVYGAGEAESLEVSLSAEPADGGVLRRLGEGLRIVSPRDAIAVQWQEAGENPGILGKHLRLDLSQLQPGAYTLRLEVRDGTGQPAVALRSIEVSAP